jgi:hypothetical protein
VSRSGGLEHPRRPRDHAERGRDGGERLGLVELAGHDQHGVVRLVVLRVEAAQRRHRHPLDVGARADHRLAVVVPEERRADEPGVEQLERLVLADLELVAHHGELGGQVLRQEERVHHAVGFHREGEFEVVAGRGQGLVVVGPIGVGRAVVVGAARLHDLPHVAVTLRALEQHVLEQVGHAALAVALVARADQVGDVDRDLVLRVVGEEQDAQAVVELVLADAFDGAELLRRRLGSRGGGGRGGGGRGGRRGLAGAQGSEEDRGELHGPHVGPSGSCREARPGGRPRRAAGPRSRRGSCPCRARAPR